MDNKPNIREQVRKAVRECLLSKGDNGGFADSDSLFVSRRLDSMDSLSLILFLEETFGISFEDSGFDQMMVDSVDSIVALIEKRSGQVKLLP